MKKALKWIGIFFVVAIGLSIAFGEKKPKATLTAATPEAHADAGSAAPPPEEPAKQQKETYKTTATKLFSDYEENEVAADEKMKNKLIEISGSIQAIDKDFSDAIIVRLKTSNEFMPASFQIAEAQKQAAISLKKGAKITISCEGMSRLVGSPYGKDCQIL